MYKVIDIIKEKYLIGSQGVEILPDGNILFTEDDGVETTLSKMEFLKDYIDFLTDLLNFNNSICEYSICMEILKDLNLLYDAIDCLKVINDSLNKQ